MCFTEIRVANNHGPTAGGREKELSWGWGMHLPWPGNGNRRGKKTSREEVVGLGSHVKICHSTIYCRGVGVICPYVQPDTETSSID